MTDRRLPPKIIAKKKQNRIAFWGILFAFVSALAGFFFLYFLDVGGSLFEKKPPSLSEPTEIESEQEAWEESIYTMEDIDKFEEDVIADQTVEDSDIVRIFKQQEKASASPLKAQKPKWLKNAAPWPYKLNRPMVAIVINDVSQSKRQEWRQLKKYNIPLTYTIAGDDKNYRKLAKAAKKKGREVVAHIPMEPLYPEKLPKSMRKKKWLKTTDSRQKMKKYLEGLLKKTPYVIGISNQMGSAFTSHKESIQALLEILKGKGYIFLDSMTTKDSQALNVAKDITAPYLRRHLSFTFKDKKGDIKAVANRVLANNQYLVLFVNPEATALKQTLDWVKEKQKEGVVFVPLTAIMRRSMVQQKLPLNIDQKSKVFLRSPGLV